MPAQVDVHGRVPFLQRGRNEHPVAHDPGIVDHHVEVTEGFQRGIDDPLGRVPVGDVLVVGDRLAPGGADFLYHGIGGRGVAPFAVQRGADVVDHHVGPFRAKGQGIGPAQAAGGAGDDDGASFADTHYSLSIIVTLAWPPPSHMVCSP